MGDYIKDMAGINLEFNVESKKFKKRVNKHQKMAEKAMVSNPQTRNNDWDLLFDALEQKGLRFLNSYQKEQIKMSGINIHTLVRERRRIQANGMLLPTDPEVTKRRRLLAADYAEHYSGESK